MVVIGVTQKFWTEGVEGGLREAGVDGVRGYYQKMLEQLAELSKLVRQKLTKLQGKTMSALIVMEVRPCPP